MDGIHSSVGGLEAPRTDMSNLAQLDPQALAAFRSQVQQRYDAFKARGLKLDLTRGKPSSAQLDVSNPLLALPGANDYAASDKTDCRNYGDLQGLPELRALLAPLFGVTADQTIIGDNSSLALMHDAIVYSLLLGSSDSPTPWSTGARRRFSVRCRATTVTSRSVRTSGSR